MLLALKISLLTAVVSLGSVVLDPVRPHLNSLESKGRMDWDDYVDDFIISQSAEITEVAPGELIDRLRKQHAPTKLSFSSLKVQFMPNQIPEKIKEGDQLDALNKCSVRKCDVKLHFDSEVLPLLKASNRLTSYSDLLERRLQNYASSRELKGYEKRSDNVSYAKKVIRLSRFMRSKYPKTYEFLMDGFWRKKPSPALLQSDYFRTELIQIAGERSQPIFRITHNSEFQEAGYLNIEFHLYTNHFMDSSMRIFEIFPWPKDPQKSVYIVTDFAEIDELKKGPLIRSLFKSRMEEALAEFRKKEMKALR